MKKLFLIICILQLLFLQKGICQYSNLSVSTDNTKFCSTGSLIHVSGTVTARSNISFGYHFTGLIFHFYYLNAGFQQPIGNYTVSYVAGSTQTSYANINTLYFNGSQIGNGTVTANTYNDGSPLNGGIFSASLILPWATFLNSSGTQFYVAVEGVDQGGSTTSVSAKIAFDNPILYPNATLSKPDINTTRTTLCPSEQATITTSPDLSGTYNYNWYKDGSLLSGETTATLTASSPGSYYAYIYDACQNISTDNIVITTGAVPLPPVISSSNGTLLCNGATTTLSTSPSSGGTINWSNGATGNSITVSAAGTYYATEVNSCGSSLLSNLINIVTGSTAPAPTVMSNNGTLLCNGASTTLTTSPSAGGIINWNTGATGNSITVSAAGNYYAYETNSCGSGPNSNTISISTNNTPPAPTLSISGSMTLCNGFNQTISTSPSTVGGVIHWSNGATGNSITVNSNGNYYAWETGGCGNSANSASLVVTTINTPSAPTVTPAGPLALCGGASTTLTSSGTVPANILWYFNGASTGQFGTTYIISAAGNYSTKELSACGTSPSSNSISILTNSTPPAPSLNVSGTILLCDGASQTISGSPSTSGGVLHWSTGATGNSITVSSPGNYYAWETNTTCGTGPNSATITISTLNKPTAPVVNPPTNQLLCNGATATLTSSGSSITWSNGTVGNTLVTGVAGNYYATDNNACGNSAASNTVVITTGNCPIPAPGSSFFICPGKTKLIDAGAGYDSYLWNTGATTQTITVGPGTYSVTVMKNGCYATSATVTVSYYTVGASLISASGPTSFCAGGSVTLSSSVGASYLWSNGATSNSIVVNASGTFAVTVTDANGCQATSASVTTVVNPLPNASISGSTSVCVNASSPTITFNGSGGTAPYTFIYKLNGSANQTITTTSGNSISITVPTGSAGTYTYTLMGVSESSGTTCSNSASGTATVVVNPLPSATIAGSTAVCLNSASPSVSFTGSGATPPYTFTYQINGGSAQTITTISGSSVSLSVPTSSTGTFNYTLIGVQESSGTSCNNAASGSVIVVVNPLPTATILGNNTVCQNSTQPQIIFNGSGGTSPYTFSYKINGGSVQTVNTISGNSVAVNVPTVTPGTFAYTLISVQESSGTSCTSSVSGTATVTVNPLPTATIAGSTTVCQNSSSPLVTFTGSGATAPYKFTYKINGGASQTITTVSGNSISLNVPTSSAGTNTYSLISVQESGVNGCINAASSSATIVVNPLPTATISGTTTVCQNSSAPLITFTGSGATAPYTFIYKINNGANKTVTTVSGNSVSINVPTSSAGTFIYTLLSVQESGVNACLNSVSGSATVVVNPLPAATIAGSATVCQNSAAPAIIFTGSGATAPYTFIYKINGGANQTVTTTSGNSVSVSTPTTTPGTYTYSLVSVQESGSTTCLNAASGSATVVVNPLPAAGIVGTTTVCQNNAAPSITFTGSGATPPYTFTFNINGGANQTVTTVSGNSVSVSVPTNVAGTFTYSLVSVQESSGITCSNTVSGSATVTINPLPTATIAGTTVVCQYSGSPSITFTGSSATAHYIFIYSINGGANKTITTTSGNSVTVSVPTNTAGVFTYSLISVQESSGTSCINTVTGSAIVTVNPQPAKALIAAPNAHLCNGDTGMITVTNYQSGFTYTWYKDGVLFRTTTFDTIHISQAGSYTVMATSDKGCDAASISDPVIISTGIVSKPVITGYLKVCPDGKTKLVVLPTDSTLLYEVWRWTDPPDTKVLNRDSIFSALAGQYLVYVEREGCADSAIVAITADDTDFPAGKLTITPNHIPYGGQATMIAEVTGAANYQWDLGDGKIIATPSASMMQNYYITSDSIAIKLLAISERNCITAFTGSLSVGARAIDTIPDHSYAGNLKDWNVFPIPFHNELKVSAILKRNETVRMDLFTVEGKWIRSWQLAGKKGENLFVLDNLEGLRLNVVYLITGLYNGEKHFDKVYKY